MNLNTASTGTVLALVCMPNQRVHKQLEHSAFSNQQLRRHHAKQLLNPHLAPALTVSISSTVHLTPLFPHTSSARPCPAIGPMPNDISLSRTTAAADSPHAYPNRERLSPSACRPQLQFQSKLQFSPTCSTLAPSSVSIQHALRLSNLQVAGHQLELVLHPIAIISCRTCPAC